MPDFRTFGKTKLTFENNSCKKSKLAKDMVQPTSLDSAYLCSYVQFDTYPGNLADVLVSKYDTYEKALDLCLLSPTFEGVYKDEIIACNRWETAKDEFTRYATSAFRLPYESFGYVFEDGEWWVYKYEKMPMRVIDMAFDEKKDPDGFGYIYDPIGYKYPPVFGIRYGFKKVNEFGTYNDVKKD